MSYIVEFVKMKKGQRKGQLRGVVVAVGRNRVGWSSTAWTKGDKFRKEKGLDIAIGRASVDREHKRESNPPTMPKYLETALERMRARSVRYFKTADQTVEKK